MPHCGAGIPAKHVLNAGRLRTRRHGPRLTTGNEGLVAKLRMGWEPLAPTPFAIYVVCSRISQLWPFNSACLSTLSSVASCLSALPFTLFRSAYLRPTPLVKLASSAIPRVRPLASLHPSNLLPSIPDPSLARTLIPRSSSCPLISRTSTSRSPAAPVIHRNGTRTL